MIVQASAIGGLMWLSFSSPYADKDPTLPKVVRTIAAFIGAQHPDKHPLTFLGLVEQLREQFGAVTQNVVVEKKPLADD